MLLLEQHVENVEFKNAVIIVLASTICLAIVNFFHIESGFFALLAITAVATVFPTKIFEMGIYRFLGSASALVAQAVVLTITHSFWIVCLINFSLIAISGYFIAKKRMNYFFVFFIITTGIVYYFAFSEPNFAFKLGLLWVVNIGLGLAVLFFVKGVIPFRTCLPANHMSSSTELDLTLDKQSLLVAGRISLTVMAVIIFSRVAHLEGGGLQAVISATVLTLQPDVNTTNKQAWYRLLGVLLGGVSTLIAAVILLQIPHFFMLIVLYGWLLFFFTYSAFKKQKFSYVFLQASIVVILVLTVQQGPIVSVSLLWERLLGVIVGFIGAIFFLQAENILGAKGGK